VLGLSATIFGKVEDFLGYIVTPHNFPVLYKSSQSSLPVSMRLYLGISLLLVITLSNYSCNRHGGVDCAKGVGDMRFNRYRMDT